MNSDLSLLTSPTVEMLRNPFVFFRELGSRDPLIYDEERDIWHATGYNVCRKILNDREHFSSDDGLGIGNEFSPTSNSILTSDPPAHIDLRHKYHEFVSSENIQGLMPEIEKICISLLQASESFDEFDFVQRIAVPLPYLTMSLLMGTNLSEWRIHRMYNTAFEVGNLPYVKKGIRNFVDGIDSSQSTPTKSKFLDSILNPPETAIEQGIDSAGNFFIFMGAGSENVTNLLGNALICMKEQNIALPDAFDDNFVSGLVEETLRFRSPLQLIFRVTSSDVDIAGKSIKKGSSIGVWLGVANRDATAFSNPDTFDITRNPNNHLGFGSGPHNCLGATLARTEAKIALTTLFKNYDLEIIDGDYRKSMNNRLLHGIEFGLVAHGMDSIMVRISPKT